MKPIFAFLLLSLALSLDVHAADPALPTIPSSVFNVTDYGAVGDGVTDNTISIQETIYAASASGGGVVEIPAGTFLSGPITLFSTINLQVDTNGMLQMLPFGTYPGGTTDAQTFIGCNGVQDVEISGSGIIDGQGAAWWDYFNNVDSSVNRPMLLNLYNCDRLFIHDITFQNPPNHTCGLRQNGGNILISNLTVNTVYPSPNTDGLNFVGTNCIIENCHISDGDDNIAMGSTGPLYDLVITNCQFGNGHGVSIGSGISGVTSLTVVDCGFNSTDNGLRIKCAQDNSLPILGLNYCNLAMTNVGIPIVFYSYYNIVGTPDNIPTSEVLAPSNNLPVNSTTPNWSGITVSNLTATSRDIGGIIWGPTEWPITNVTLDHVTITAPKTFDLYNVYGVEVIDSVFNFSSGNTFTLCNAGLTVSNSTPGGQVVTIGGAASGNSLALYNVNATMTSTDAFTCNPIALSDGVLTNTGNLTFSTNQVFQFALGTGVTSMMVISGNLALNGTVNITNAPGFVATNYVLFNYSGSLSGQAAVGSMPPGYSGVLDTSTAGEVKLKATYTGVFAVPTTNVIQSSMNPSAFSAPVTFTATITPAPTDGETVTFQDGATLLGTGTLAGGQAVFTTATNQLAMGAHAITASYSGDATFEPSTSGVLTQIVNPPSGIHFDDTFTASTVDSTTPEPPSEIGAGYQVLSGKPWNPVPYISSGYLIFGIGGTSSGVVEAQARFAATPIALNDPGDYVQMSLTFWNGEGILSQTGVWGFGLYNSGGVPPVSGGLNNSLNKTANNAAFGGTQNWQGYMGQIAFLGGNCGFYDREAQMGTVNNNQDLISTGTSSSYANPAAFPIGSPSTAPSVNLTNVGPYTEILTYTLTAANTLQLTSQLYAGFDTNGTLLSSMSATTGAPVTTSFDGLALGWRATGSTPSVILVSSIVITGQSTTILPPVLGFAVTGSTLTLDWPGNYLGWSLQSNASGLESGIWSTVPDSENVTNYSVSMTPTNVFYRLISPP